jgi:hypothetical protein
MKVTHTSDGGLESFEAMLRSPDALAERMTAEYAHLRCPNHGDGPRFVAADDGMTVSYCCEQLQALVHADKAKQGA